ncbi:nitroreductase [Epibacterium sp. SM1969]|uniref:Putative NAD(P)H nitroreductase n=1 Tax=Tritonibacter aquimaris TaxID=2663379 RepID=A0A844AY92_9RHOB|nr:nitroreductase [Tritonibacter aquimaris]MQY43314.1 nitroreductase [Tritonibacter aquimaris]
MSTRNDAALEFLLSRRSRPAKTLQEPVPNRDELDTILTAASRTPDHGAIVPWRFVVVQKPAMVRLADLVETAGKRLGKTDAEIEKGRSQFEMSHLAVVVVEVQKPSAKVPAIEQTYAAAGACLSLVNAALASGWGANWISGWASHEAQFCTEAFGTESHERVVGIVHLGTESKRPPERPRPQLDQITSWISE